MNYEQLPPDPRSGKCEEVHATSEFCIIIFGVILETSYYIFYCYFYFALYPYLYGMKKPGRSILLRQE